MCNSTIISWDYTSQIYQQNEKKKKITMRTFIGRCWYLAIRALIETFKACSKKIYAIKLFLEHYELISMISLNYKWFISSLNQSTNWLNFRRKTLAIKIKKMITICGRCIIEDGGGLDIRRERNWNQQNHPSSLYNSLKGWVLNYY